jgi:hypothetical protein
MMHATSVFTQWNRQAPRMPTQSQSTSAAGATARSRPLPGMVPAAIAVMLSMSGMCGWLLSSNTIAPSREIGPAAQPSEISQVEERDIEGAVSTLAGTPAWREQFKQRESKCPVPLAWVTVAPASRPTGQTVRIQSGSYYSPNFTLSDVPVRIAVPYPAPLQTGHGSLIILHSEGTITVALRPPMEIPGLEASAKRSVTWDPTSRCKQPNG